MAICPHCHTMDKAFFAPKCHECNTEVGFIEQCIVSLLYNVTLYGITLGAIYLVINWLTNL